MSVSWPRAAALALLLVPLPGLAADVDAYVRPGCPHCADAEEFLERLSSERPGLDVAYHDVTASDEARARLEAISAAHGVGAPGVPSFVIGDALVVGFADATTTGARIVGLLEGSSAPEATGPVGDVCEPAVPCAEPVGETPVANVDLPLLGRLDVERLGLPLFTVILGLLDGFNPCATWVLLFLLSLLVRLRSRAKMVAVAGTFVVVSGLVYFAFMAAWLNVFFLLGVSRPIQLAMALLALGIGAVNARDGLARDGGFTLSIPDRFKPMVMERSRAASRAESLPRAIAGVAGLAVVVNLVELLCTAGLPALFTSVLAQHDLSRVAHYGYLALYDLAYVADDSLLVGVAVATLSRTRLQERGGRLLKLVSGAVMLALGLVLLLRPSWLAFG